MPVREHPPKTVPEDHEQSSRRIPAFAIAGSTSREPRGRSVGWFRPFVLAAGFGLTVLANDGARADDTLTTDPESDPGPNLWSSGAPIRSFGLGGLAFGSGSEGSFRPWEQSPTGFTLWPEFRTTEGPERPSIRWDLALEPPFRPAPVPGAPLRGVRNEFSPLGTKFLRGTLIITGTALASGVVLAVMPRQFTKWDDDALSRGTSNFRRAWTELPVWDSDVPFHNWIGHPYAGAFYYNMVRSQGGTIRQSFAFAVFQSVMWEYLVEAVAEQPSIQDLIATPIMGSVLGELFNRWSVAILSKGPLNFGQKALVFFLNPSYVINNGYRPPE